MMNAKEVRKALAEEFCAVDGTYPFRGKKTKDGYRFKNGKEFEVIRNQGWKLFGGTNLDPKKSDVWFVAESYKGELIRLETVTSQDDLVKDMSAIRLVLLKAYRVTNIRGEENEKF